MTEFGRTLLVWAQDLDQFSIDQAKKKFPNCCQRKMNATIQGAVVAGYLKSEKTNNGSLVFKTIRDNIDHIHG